MYCCFFFQAEDGIRDLVRSRGLGDVYKRQHLVNEFLTFRLGKEEYGIEILKVQEIRGYDSITRLSLIHI